MSTKSPKTSASGNTKKSKGDDHPNLHRDIIVGSFIIGTLAFLTAHAWNAFFLKVVATEAEAHVQNQDNENTKTFTPDKDMKQATAVHQKELLYYGLYALFVTIFDVIVVYAMIKLEWIKHAPTKL